MQTTKISLQFWASSSLSSMAASWEVVVLSFCLVICCTLALRRRSSTGGKRLPPGPSPWPIVGNMFQLTPMLHKCFGELAKTYGPLVFARFGYSKILVVCNAQMAKTVLKVQDADFCSRPHSTASVGIVTFDFNDFLMLKHDAKYRQLKKIIVTELLSAKRLATFQIKRTEEIVSMLRFIKKESDEGKLIQPHEKFYQCFCNGITTMLANKAYFGPESNIEQRLEFFGNINAALSLFSSFNPGDYFPILKPFDLLGVERKSRIIRGRLHKFLQRMVDEHRQKSQDERKESYVEDFVDILLSCPGLEGNKPLPDETIRAILLDMLIAGTDTSSNTTEWAMAELLRNPHIMRKAQAELDSVVGRDRLVTEDDLPNLPYINAILRENFRFHPAVPTGAPHAPPKGGCELAGYYIPEDTTIMVNIWAIGRDPATWERPDEFDPERFLGDNTRDVKGKDFELLPFGAGRRMCVGLNLALILTHLTLANMLHCFHWSLPDGQTSETLNVEETAGWTACMKYRLQLVASPRLSPAVYSSPL